MDAVGAAGVMMQWSGASASSVKLAKFKCTNTPHPTAEPHFAEIGCTNTPHPPAESHFAEFRCTCAPQHFRIKGTNPSHFLTSLLSTTTKGISPSLPPISPLSATIKGISPSISPHQPTFLHNQGDFSLSCLPSAHFPPPSKGLLPLFAPPPAELSPHQPTSRHNYLVTSQQPPRPPTSSTQPTPPAPILPPIMPKSPLHSKKGAS